MVKPERKTKLQRGMMKPNMFKNNPGFPSQDLIVQVVTFLRIHEFSHKIWPCRMCKTALAPSFLEDSTDPRLEHLGHANPPKKIQQKLIPNFSPQQKALSTFPGFLLLNHLYYMNERLFQIFLLKSMREKFHKKFKSFAVSFSASALAFFTASKASASALRFVPWRFFENRFHEVGNKTEGLNSVEPLTDLKNQYVPPSFRLKNTYLLFEL